MAENSTGNESGEKAPAKPATRLSSRSLTWQLESFPVLSSERVVPPSPFTDYNNKETVASQ